MEATTEKPSYSFLSDGEMGGLIRNYDWSQNPVGAIRDWPVSLRVQVSLMLRSRFPMLIFWGPDLITFYNDAFRPSLGEDGKHPGSLGQRGEESWAESWPVIGSMIHNIMAGGEAVWFEDQKLPLYRDGKMGYAYWTYSFSPIINDEGVVNGVLVTCSETTKGVESLQQLNATNAELKQSLEANTALQQDRLKKDAQFRHVTGSAPTGLWLSDEEGGLTYLNSTLADWTGMPYEALLGAGWANAIVEEDRPGAAMAFLTAVAARAHYDTRFRINRKDGAVIWCHAAGDPFYKEDGSYGGYAGFCSDIQALVETQQQIRQSETRFRTLAEQALMFVFESDPDANVVYWNPRWQEFVGQTAQEALGREGWAKAIHPEDYERMLSTYGTATAAKEYYEIEVRIRRGDGIYRNVLFTGKPRYTSGGTFDGYIGNGIDITSQVEMRLAIEEKEAALRDAIELAKLATWSVNLAANEVIYSPRFQEWTGLTKNAFKRGEASVLHDADRARIGAALARAFEPGSNGSFDETYTIVHSKTGQRRIIHTVGTVLFSEGKAVSFSGVAQDVTIQQEQQLALENTVQQRTEELAAAVEELRATNEELAETNEQLIHSNEELGQYAYVASHDLQEPLRKIRIFTGMLEGAKELTPGSKSTLAKIGSSADRMSLLIQDLLSFSRLLQSDALMRPVALAEIMKAVWTDFELVVAEKEAIMEVGPLPVVEAISLQMNQLFYNLISNALKFTVAGKQPRITVQSMRISPEAAGKYLAKPFLFTSYHHLSVSDNGIGFEAKYNDQIFEVFKRLHGRDAYPGSGIGLALCRRIAANHNGHLYAVSEPGAGSTFHIILPERQHEGAGF